MTEKRYKLSEPNGAYLIDDDKVYAHWINDDDKIIDLLNALHEENELLKKSVKRQQNSNNECAKLIEEQQKENEQLKARIQLLSTLLDNADAIIDLSNNGIAKAFWKKRNNEINQECKMRYQKGDVK